LSKEFRKERKGMERKIILGRKKVYKNGRFGL